MERIISAERVEDILNVFGSFDQNLHIIEKEWNVCVTDRDAGAEDLRRAGGRGIRGKGSAEPADARPHAARTWTNSACAM